MHSTLTRTHRTALCTSSTLKRRRAVNIVRCYAAHRGSLDSSPLSQSLDQNRRAPRSRDTVGPFQLGLSQPTTVYEEVKPWSQLSKSGKVVRATARTTNLTVILLGAGLSALLVYSLTSELFSSNSPTVLHNQACERIKSSPEISKCLRAPLAFNNNPPSVVRPRHRSRHVASQIFNDQTGREHMLLHFYVQGKPLDSREHQDASYWDWISTITHDSLNNLTWDEMVAWTKECGSDLAEKSKNVFRYVSGAPSPPTPSAMTGVAPNHDTGETKQEDGGFFGLFSALRQARGPSVSKFAEGEARMWTEGEVHAELIRNDEGYFVFKYLLVDFPNSRSRPSTRVFVEKEAGVRENVPIMRWHSD